MGISFFPKVVKFFDLFEKQSNMVKDATELLNSIFQDFSDVPPNASGSTGWKPRATASRAKSPRSWP